MVFRRARDVEKSCRIVSLIEEDCQCAEDYILLDRGGDVRLNGGSEVGNSVVVERLSDVL
jgi:hypothetical protein